jgi:hypothetical protein
MGYADFSLNNFLALPAVEARDEARGRGYAEGRDCSWGKPNLFSDFLQSIVI